MAAAATYPVATIAKLLMLTERRVQQLAKEGVLPRAEKGRYELAPVVQAYIKYLRDRAIGADLPGAPLGEHRTRLYKARADIAEFEAERLAGTLIPADDVERAWTAAANRVKQRGLAIAPKAAPLVAVETDTDACQEIIETFVHETLAELAATDVKVESPPGGEGAADGVLPDVHAAAEAEDIGVE